MNDQANGVLNLNKPAGITSQQAVARVKKLLGAKRAGHAGTLDPQATGVLLVCLERATKITPFLMDTTKGYAVQMVLGRETDTQDAWGTVVNTKPVPPLTKGRVEEALKNFEGEMEQVPPMYSALRFRGKRLYQLAREGREVERRARKVCVRSLTLREFSPPVIGFEVLCSSGTYVRTLCHDLGRLLGCGAHLSALERTSVGPFRIERAHTLEAIEELALMNRAGEALISMDEALSFLPAFTVREEYIERVLHGAPVLAGWASGAGGRFSSGDMVRVKSPDSRLLAVGEAMLDSEQITPRERASHALKMKRVLVTSSL